MNRKFITLAAIAVFVGSTYLLGYSSSFTVSSIEVTGSNRFVSTGITQGERLARIEPRAIATKLESLDWIQSAQVSRNWINGKVVIEITQRTPIAIFKNQVIDSSGSSFVPQGETPSGLVEIQARGIEEATKAVKFFVELPEELKSSLSVVKVRATGALVFIVENGGKKLEVRWGTNSENELKFKVYNALIALPENSDIKRVDVSAPRAPIVK
jgi:cell division protein FtsQ